MSESETNFVPLVEAAQFLATTEARVLMMLKSNDLQGKMFDGAWYVEQSSLDHCNKPKETDIVESGGCGICGSGCGNGC